MKANAQPTAYLELAANTLEDCSQVLDGIAVLLNVAAKQRDESFHLYRLAEWAAEQAANVAREGVVQARAATET